MKITATYEYQVCKHFITALAYGDISGLDDNDIKRFKAFEADITPSKDNTMTIEYPENFDTDFDRCDITGSMGDTIEIKVHYFEA